MHEFRIFYNNFENVSFHKKMFLRHFAFEKPYMHTISKKFFSMQVISEQMLTDLL